MWMVAFVIFLVTAFLSPAAGGEVRVSYLYSLSGFTGTIPYDWARIFADQQRNEIYVVYGNSVSVFNESGMEVHRFGGDSGLGRVVDVALDDEGNILALSYLGLEYGIVRCNFRGEPLAKLEVKDLPPGFSRFSPNRMVYRKGRLYLADINSLRIAVTDEQGRFEKGYDLVSVLGLEEKDRANKVMGGFSVDGDGNMLFTIPVLFSAYRLSPEGNVRAFGQPGGTPGKFSVVGGIVSDDRGNYLVADVLKCVVMVFSQDFKFLTEFGYRGFQPGNLIAPQDLAVDGNGGIYVTQARKRGISVFRVTYD